MPLSDSQMPNDSWRAYPHTFAVLASDGAWEPQRHLKHVGGIVGPAIKAGGARLIFNMPPRMGKSWFFSYCLPVWYLNTWPDKRVILAAYGEEIATEWGRRVRNEFATNKLLATKLREDSQAAGRWHTPEGGGMMVAGVGGALSGFGGNLLLCDDLIKNWQEAHSFQSKMVLRDWWRSTFFTRKEPGASVVIAMTRWDDDDIIAWLQKEYPDVWTVISLPALAEAGDPLGRALDEPLCPERFNKEAMLRERRDVGGAVWAALYQQNPEMGADRLYSHFTQANVDDSILPRRDLPLALSFDFNVNPGNHVGIVQYDERADVFYFLDEIHGPRMDVREACDRIKVWVREHGWTFTVNKQLEIFGDASGGSQWAGTGDSCYDILERALAAIPHRVRRPASNPPIIDRVNTVNEALSDVEGKIHVKIHSRCARLIEDFRLIKPDAHGLIDKHDAKLSHASDYAGYMINYLRPLWQGGQKQIGGRAG